MKILLIGHGDYPRGLASAAKMIAGEADFLKTVSFEENDDIYSFEEKLKVQIEDYHGDILICTDIFGGSPFNVAMKIASKNAENRVRVLAGVNLPIILELSTMPINDLSVDTIIRSLTENGKESIVEGFDKLQIGHRPD